jgi:hypothetical protein
MPMASADSALGGNSGSPRSRCRALPAGAKSAHFYPGTFCQDGNFWFHFFRPSLYSLFRAQNWGDTAGLPLKYTNIAIIGGGLAGSIAAAMLGRASIPTILIDPHQAYPFDFRVEKISGDEHLGRFYQTGITDSVLRSATHDGENWIARFGCLLDKKPSRQLRHQVRRADRNDPGGLSGRQSVMARSERMMVRSEASS